MIQLGRARDFEQLRFLMRVHGLRPVAGESEEERVRRLIIGDVGNAPLGSVTEEKRHLIRREFGMAELYPVQVPIFIAPDVTYRQLIAGAQYDEPANSLEKAFPLDETVNQSLVGNSVAFPYRFPKALSADEVAKLLADEGKIGAYLPHLVEFSRQHPDTQKECFVVAPNHHVATSIKSKIGLLLHSDVAYLYGDEHSRAIGVRPRKEIWPAGTVFLALAKPENHKKRREDTK